MKLIQLNKVERTFSEDGGAEVEISRPVIINGDNIRAFYARRESKPGTRITFSDGGGFAVTELVHEILHLLDADDLPGHDNNVAQLAPPAQVS